MFRLHERLEADTFAILDFPLSSVRLMNDATYPWLVLVPRRAGVREFYELSATDRRQLMEEMSAASDAVNRLYQPDKMNVAAIGNMVAQLHIHVVARNVGDPAWPGPVWGAHPAEPYEGAMWEEQAAKIEGALVGLFD